MLDILKDEQGVWLIKDGDFATGRSDEKHQHDLLVARKGAYKMFPHVGVGVKDLYDDENPKTILQEVKEQFEQDGMYVSQIRLDATGNLIIKATYN